MAQLGVSDQFVKVDPAFKTAESFIFLQEDGERSIIMATGATSLIDGPAAAASFTQALQSPSLRIFSSEISQVPLSGVIELQNVVKKRNVLNAIDLDVSPAVAVYEAGLGSVEQVLECVPHAQAYSRFDDTRTLR